MKQTKKEQRLRSTIRQELNNAENADYHSMHQSHDNALKFYYGELPNPDQQEDIYADPSRSPIISTDVSDMVNAVLAQLTPMLSTDALVSFEAKGKADEEQAQSESAAVNHVILEQNEGFIELEEAIKDALLMRNCAAKVYVDDDVDTRLIPTEGLSDEEINVLLQTRLPREERELVGDNVRVTTTYRKFCFDAVPFENILYEANVSDTNLQKLRFFAERLYYTRSELIEMGFPKKVIEELQKSQEEKITVSRRRNASYQTTRNSTTEDQESIECYECYQLIDLDGDGISERYKVLMAGGWVLDYEPCDLIPYSVGTAFLASHRIAGESLAERVIPVQVYKSHILRNWLDNQERVIHGQWVGDPDKTNFDDIMLNAGVVRHKDGAMRPDRMEVRDLGPSMAAALEYQDKMRTEKGGAALDMMSADAQLVGETAYGIERQYAQREMLVSFMGRNLSETFIRPLYLLMHEYMRRYANAPIELKMAGEWTQVDPQQWPKRERVTVRAGMTAGERTHIQRTLQQLLNYQLQAIQSGQNGVLADLSTVYNTILDWCSYAGIDDADRYVINPRSQAAQQAAQANSQAQQQAQQQAAQAQQALIREQLQLEYAKLQQKAKESGDELAYKYWSDRLKSETEEMKIVASGTIDLEKVQMQGEQRETEAGRINGTANGTANTGASEGRV